MDEVTDQEVTHHVVSPSFPTSFQLSPDLWFDPATAIIVRQGEGILLTVREAAVLKILLKPPYAWHTSRSLARKLSKRFAVVVEAHSIEQIIYGLRHKLGESGTHPHILLSHYGHGYRIVPQKTDSSHWDG